MFDNKILPSNVSVRSLRALYYGDIDTCKSVLSSICKHYACILHDKDTDGDGNLKKSHIHILARFNSPKTFKNFSKFFDEKLANVAYVFDDDLISSYWKYLTHISFNGEPIEGKYIYSYDDIQCDNLSYWEREVDNHTVRIRSPTDDISLQIFDDWDTLSFYELCRKYGREFILNASRYQYAHDRYIESRSNYERTHMKEFIENEKNIKIGEVETYASLKENNKIKE